jgi:hypothetical protein
LFLQFCLKLTKKHKAAMFKGHPLIFDNNSVIGIAHESFR